MSLSANQEKLAIIILMNQPVVVCFSAKICHIKNGVVICHKSVFTSLVRKNLVSPGISTYTKNGTEVYREVKVIGRKRPPINIRSNLK